MRSLCLILVGAVLACGSGSDANQGRPDGDASDVNQERPDGGRSDSAQDRRDGDGACENPSCIPVPPAFAANAMAGVVPAAGYVDSPFVTLSGNRVYFLYSPYSASVLLGGSPASACPPAAIPQGHVYAPGLEWNTDLYYATWDGQAWHGPTNVGAPVNTLGMECCVFVNRDETEMIFYRETDLDGDGTDGDLGLPPTGNYRSTRASAADVAELG